MRREESLPDRIRRLSSRQYRKLVFPPGLEVKFAAETSSFRQDRHWLEGLVGLGLYTLFACVSAALAAQRSAYPDCMRMGLVVPLALLVNGAAYLRLSSWVVETGTVIVVCAAGSVEIALQKAHPQSSEAISHLAVLSVLIFANAVMRLCLPYAGATVCWALLAEWLLLSRSPAEAFPQALLPAVMVVAAGLMTLVTRYGQEREVRLAFLKQAEQKNLVHDLSKTNEHLETVAMQDSLTGLPNRAALDEHLRRTWRESGYANTTCSVVLVDIDRFKQVNDRFGHLYGDRVLRRVAHLLSEALRGEDDFVARFGGEEFVVLLPRTPAHLAVIVAERLRSLVELAGFPSVRSNDPSLKEMRATISCGVAAAQPSLLSDPYLMIEAADKALYQAKRGGRNRVCSLACVDESLLIPPGAQSAPQ